MEALALLVRRARHGHFRLDRRARSNIPRIAAATLGMAALLMVLRLLLTPALAGPAMLRLRALAALIAAGIVSFAVLILALRVTDCRELRGQLARSRGHPAFTRPDHGGKTPP